MNHNFNNNLNKFFNRELYIRLITSLILCTIFLFALISSSHVPISGLIITSLLFILFYEWPKLFDYRKITFWLIMPIYPILPFVLLLLLEYQNYRNLIILLVSLIAAADVGGFVAGKIFGKHKICKTISPGKTWEGFFGGYILTCLIASLFFFKSITLALLFCLTFCFLALVGDLFESYLKRRVNLKDSGSILPGHGGLLDRFDSLLFAVFLIYWFRVELQYFIFKI